MNFEDVLGDDVFQNAINYLKVDCKIDVGFCSQRPGSMKLSATSTAIIIYALKTLKQLSPEEENLLCNELMSFQILCGSYQGAFGILKDNDITTWSTSQACLALEALKRDNDCLNNGIMWLCKVQNDNGGWSFNGKSDSTKIEYCFYPLLVLFKYSRQNEITKKALTLGLSYVSMYKANTTLEKIMRIFILERIYVQNIDSSRELDAMLSLRNDILRDFSGDKIVDSDNIHFYVDFYLPAYYLLIREFIKPDNSLSLYLIKVLQDSLIKGKGWAPPFRKEPFSWTTSLALVTIFFWIHDCKKYCLSDSEVINKLRSIKKDDITMETHIERCPLNGGLCNKTDEISHEYGDNKIFLDIPYNMEYLTFEEVLINTIKENGLKPIMAKDSIKSKALLCKICTLIQECKKKVAEALFIIITNAKIRVSENPAKRKWLVKIVSKIKWLTNVGSCSRPRISAELQKRL